MISLSLFFFFADDMILLYIKNPKELTKNNKANKWIQQSCRENQYPKIICVSIEQQLTTQKGNQEAPSIYNSTNKDKICSNKSDQEGERFECWKLKIHC